MNIYVSNLSNELTWEKLKQVFTVFGEVKHVLILCDERARGGKAERYAYVEMPIKSEGTNAISKLNRTMIGGRIISTIEALPLSNKIMKAPTRKSLSRFGHS